MISENAGGRYKRHLDVVRDSLGSKGKGELAKIGAITLGEPERTQERQIGLFALSRDNTGALKGQLLGRDLARTLSEREGRLHFTAEKRITKQAEDERHVLGMVSLVELPKINSEEGHEGGNAAMVATVQRVEDAIRRAIGVSLPVGDSKEIENYYEIYHTDGGDFAYTLQLPNTLTRSVNALVHSLTDDIGQTNGNDPLLAAIAMTRADAIDLFNDLQETLEEDSDQYVSDHEISRPFIDLMRKGTKINLERKSLERKIRRYIDKRVSGDDDAEIYFEKFVQRDLAGSDFASAESLTISGDTPTERSASVLEAQRKIPAIAEAVVKHKIVQERARVPYVEQRAFDVIIGEDLPRVPELRDTDQELLLQLQTVAADTLTTDRLVKTDGWIQLDTYDTVLRLVGGQLHEIELAGNTIQENQVEIIQDLIQYRSLFPPIRKSDEPTLLEGEAQLLRRITAGTELSQDEYRLLQRIYNTAKEEYALLELRFDSLTGLPNRTEYILQLEDRLRDRERLEEGQRVQTLFVDLGFLKFVNLGGREVGNYALQSTAEILEKALEDAGISDGQAFRYAGDEFTCLFTGTDQDAQNLVLAIHTLKEQLGPIPRTENSSPLYRPEKLSINYGITDHTLAEETLEELKRRGLYTSQGDEKDLAYLANLQNRIADTLVEPQKAESRFVQLLDRVATVFPDDEIPSESSSTILQKQVETLVQYSKKAIYGVSLEDLHALTKDPMWGFPDTGIVDMDRLRELIARQEKLHRKRILNRRDLEDAIVGNYVSQKRMEEQLAHAETQLDSSRIEVLRRELAALQLDRELLDIVQEQ